MNLLNKWPAAIWPQRGRLALVAATLAASLAVLVVWFPSMGGSLTGLMLVPVALAGWLYGAGSGVIVSVLAAVLTVLALFLRGTGWDEMIVQGAPMGFMTMVLVGYAIGRQSELRRRLERELTMRRQTGQALRESESRFKALFRGLPVSTWTFDQDGTVLDWNEACERLYGWPAAEAVGRTMYDLMVREENVASTRRAIAGIFDGRTFVGLEYEDRRADGSSCYVLANEYPIRDADGRVIMGVCALVDITERRQAEQALRASEQRFRHLFERVPVGLYRTAPDGRILDANPALVEILGYPDREALLAQHAGKVYANPADRQRWQQMIEQGGGELRELEVQWMRYDGGLIWVQEDSRQILDESGQVLHYEGAIADISERKRAEQQLRDAQERFLIVLDGIDADIYVADMQSYEILYTNQHMRESFDADLVGRICYQVFRGEQDACPHCTNAQLLDADGNPTGVVAWEGQNPITKRWYMNYDRAIRWVDGRWVRLQIATNITARKQAEAERERLLAAEQARRRIADTLRETSQIIGSTLELDTVLGSILDELHKVVAYDTGALWLVDRARKELFPQEWRGYQGLTDRSYRMPLDSAIGVTAYVTRSGEAVLIADTSEDGRYLGELFDGRSEMSAPLAIKGQVIGVLNVEHGQPNAYGEEDLALLVTFANQAAIAIENARLVQGLEAEVAARTAEIRAEQEKSDAVLRSVGDAIAMVGLDMRIQFVNRAFTALTGYKAQEAAGRPINMMIGEQLHEPQSREMRAALDAGRVWQGELVGRRKDGRTYDAVMEMAPMRDPEGQLIGYVSSHQDISRFKELERARARFMTSVSHELRTPVTNMKLYAQLLRQGISSEKAPHYLRVLVEQADRLGALVQDILEMTEFDAGRAVQAWEPVVFSSLLGDAIIRFEGQARSAGLALEARPVPADLPPVKGDAVRLGQALGELVQNAITFSAGGAGDGRIVLAAAAAEEDGCSWVALSVHDWGPGISPDEQPRIFDRFFRGKLAESGHVPGTGLGLSQAQAILEAHGGRVTVASSGVPGEGSTFTLWLPASNS